MVWFINVLISKCSHTTNMFTSHLSSSVGGQGSGVRVSLQLRRLPLGVGHHLGRELGELCHVDAEGLVARSRRYLSWVKTDTRSEALRFKSLENSNLDLETTSTAHP